MLAFGTAVGAFITCVPTGAPPPGIVILSQFLQATQCVRAEVYVPCTWTATPSGRASVQTSADHGVGGVRLPLNIILILRKSVEGLLGQPK